MNLPTREISVIFGGPGLGGKSSKSRKAHVRAIRSGPVGMPTRPEVNQVGQAVQKMTRLKECCLTFTEDEARRIVHSHDDALVISLCISNHVTCGILVDRGNSINVIFKHVFDRIEIGSAQIKPASSLLTGFIEVPIMPVATIRLQVSTGEFPARAMEEINFLIVDRCSASNVIFGRPTISQFRAVPSIYHQLMKFSTFRRVGQV